MNRRGIRFIVFGALGVSLAACAPGQDRSASKPGRAEGGLPAQAGILGPAPMRPDPQDLGEVRPGEEMALMDFARENVPSIYRFLNEARSRNPERFKQGLNRVAPRLRQLQRLFAQRPVIARRFVQHIENGDGIRRAAQAYARNHANPNARRRAENDIRRRVYENFTIERELLEDRAGDLDDRRDAIIAGDFGRLTKPGADLAPEPPRLRELAHRYLDAGDDDAPKRAGDALRDALSRRIDDEIDRARTRATALKQNSESDVDSHTRRILDDAEQAREARKGEDGPQSGRKPMARPDETGKPDRPRPKP